VPLRQNADLCEHRTLCDRIHHVRKEDDQAALAHVGAHVGESSRVVRFFETRFEIVKMCIRDSDYIGMLHDNVTPGELTAASIIAADFKTTPQDIIREAHETHRTVIDVANARGMHALALEVFLGLIYLDYTDDPAKEAQPDGAATNQNVGV